MIPTEEEAQALWDKYHLPDNKRLHVTLVARVAVFLAHKISSTDANISLNVSLLRVGALLHDIDKVVPKLPDEHHPDASVRILHEEGMDEVALLVKTHPLHAILDPMICPKTWEQKLLYLADKMVKYEIITVDKRFDLWRAEQLPEEGVQLLDRTYPKVKELEQEIFERIQLHPEAVAGLVIS